MRGHTDHINRCTRCGDYGCYGTCTEPRCGSKGRAGEPCADPEVCGCVPKATENDLDMEELEPVEGDSYDDARWTDLMRWAEEEGGEA